MKWRACGRIATEGDPCPTASTNPETAVGDFRDACEVAFRFANALVLAT